MRLISYAQEYEDIILFNTLKKYVQKGTYVDIGANDPSIISVTKFFYDLGWRGINIEPLDDKYELLCLERSDDENYNVGISDKNGEMELNIAGTGSSFMPIDYMSNKCKKKVLLFDEIWKKSKYRKSEIHFCKIDVEGFEKKVLGGIDFSSFRPWVFVIESCLPNSNIQCHDEWESILINAGYDFTAHFGANRYYIRADKTLLKKELMNYKDLFLHNEILKVEYKNNYTLNELTFAQYKDICLFGAGYYMTNYINYYGKKYQPITIVDNSLKKQGSTISDIVIQKPNTLLSICDKDTLVVICCEKSMEIKMQLQNMGIHNIYEYVFV